MSKSNNEEEEEQYRKSIDGIARKKHVSVILPCYFYNKIILVVNKIERSNCIQLMVELQSIKHVPVISPCFFVSFCFTW